VVNPTPPATITRDVDGIAGGGIRLPDVEVPVALNDGSNSPKSLTNPLSGFCVLWGTHRDFTQAQLDARYHSTADYRRQVIQVLLQLQAQRFVLHEDAVDLLREAVRRDVT
jgi:Alpha/beta hydrolase domain